jgi:CRP-like cAMP-binding protein
MMKYTALLADIPFFRERGMKEPAMAEVLSLWQIQSVPKSEFVFEYGTYGTDYYFILDGQVEI